MNNRVVECVTLGRIVELDLLIYGVFRFSVTHCKNKRLWEFGERFGNSGQLKVLITDLSKNVILFGKWTDLEKEDKTKKTIQVFTRKAKFMDWVCVPLILAVPVTPWCQGSLWPDLWIPLIVMLSHKLSMEPTLHTIVSPTCRWHHMGAESRNFLTKMKNISISSEGGKWFFF